MILLLLLFIVVSFLFWHHSHYQTLSHPMLGKMPKLQSHRGAHSKLRENTMHAFEQSKSLGFAMIELDVQLSQDGKVVVFHDENLLRTTGENIFVEQLSASEINQLTQAPLLSDVLSSDLVPDFINIEIKNKKIFSSKIELAVAEVIRRNAKQKSVMISSFNPMTIFKMSLLLPQTLRALLATQEPSPENKIYLRKLWLAPYCRCHMLNLDNKSFSQGEIKELITRGNSISLWTVNSYDLWSTYFALGVVSIITDLEKTKP